jgi:MFS family permease
VAEFSWDIAQQGLIHGSFYWGYVLSMVPGGMLADNYGAKLIYGGSNFICSLLGFLIPAMARWHLNALLAVRFFQGFAAVIISRQKLCANNMGAFQGVTWPAMNVMASRWIPPHERSKFIATYMGNTIITVIVINLSINLSLIEWIICRQLVFMF